MRKVYLLVAISALSFFAAQAQPTCTNAPSAGPCTGGNITTDFAANDGSFTSATFTYNATNDYWNQNALRNNFYTLTSGAYLQNTTGGNIGFSLAGSTAALDDVTIRIIDANTSAVLFECQQTPAQFVAANQICVAYSGLTAGTTVRYQFIFDTNNGSSGDGTIIFDNFANGGSAAPLPVKLDNFEAAKEGSGIRLSWKTDQEQGVARYEVQRSTDGVNFSTIGSISASNAKSYTYTDALPVGTNNFYRLRIVDTDNRFKISHIVSIKSKVSMSIETYPNPVRDRLIVQHPKAIMGTRMQVVNLNGQVLRDIQLPVNAVVTPVDMTGFSNGTYYIVFRSGTETFSQRITKQ